MGHDQEFGLLVVSDLHLSEGRKETTKRFSRNEDFFFDNEFARFLQYYQDVERWKSARWHLVIAGDFLDLLQVVSIDGASPALHRDPDHPDYGLACGEDETIFKLRKIANGHWQFFEALAGFVAAGHLLTILKGNHDVEFHYARVQAALIDELKSGFARIPNPASSSSAANITTATVRFGDWFYYEKDLIWIEHGNRYDGANTFRTWLAPLMPDRPEWPTDRRDEIDLPLGSLFVRYLFNRIETVEPFADNIKPQMRFVRWMLSHHPITAMRFLLGDGRYMLRKLRRALAPLRDSAFDSRDKAHNVRLQALAVASKIPPEKLAQVDRLRAKSILEETSGFLPRCIAALVRAGLVVPLLYAALGVALILGMLSVLQIVSVLVPSVARVAATAELPKTVLTWGPLALVFVLMVAAALTVRWVLAPEETPTPSGLLDPANRIAALLGVRYVVMGHTHDAELCALDPSLRIEGGEYFNTGTWTKVFSEEERLIRNDVEFVFLQGTRLRSRDLQLKLMEWDDFAEEPRLLKLFDDGEA